MNIREKVSKNLKDAMIKKDTNLVNTLRLIVAAIKEKDINDMILAGRSSSEIQYIIDKNTHSDLRAKLELENWKKI